MPLREVDLPPAGDAVTKRVRRFLADADKRIEVFQRSSKLPAFVPSDYLVAYHTLKALAASGVARGNRFVEWGSGFGVVACLAALAGFESFGIEAEADLVTEARHLADDFGLEVEFVAGSFVPRGAEDRVHRAGEYSWFHTEGDFAYDELGLEPDDFDAVYAYPWPDEEAVTAELFDAYAGDGAMLLTYHGGTDVRVRRKVPGKKKPKRPRD